MTTRRELANAIRALSWTPCSARTPDTRHCRWNGRHRPGAVGGLSAAQSGKSHGRDRDRFVLSNGHARCCVFAAVSHLYPLTSRTSSIPPARRKTPATPVNDCLRTSRTTTGPLGQGLPTPSGMALAERLLGAQFNRPGFNIVDHYTYAFCG